MLRSALTACWPRRWLQALPGGLALCLLLAATLFPARLHADHGAGGGHAPLREPRALVSAAGVLEATLHVRFGRTAPADSGAPVSCNARLFDGEFPGPTLVVWPGDVVRLTLVNELGPETDTGEMEADMSHMTGGNFFHSPNTTNLHIHGLHTSPAEDAIFVRVGPGEQRVFELHIPADHSPGTFWYHPHHHGSSALQVAAGLAGAFVVRDPPGTLPPGSALLDMPETLLFLQELRFDGRGMHTKFENLTLLAAATGDAAPLEAVFHTPSSQTTPQLTAYFANGQYQPELALAAANRFHRLRLVNAGAVAVLELELPGCNMTLLAMDGIYRDAPRPTATVLLVPGGRADVAVRCPQPGRFELASAARPERDVYIGAKSARYTGVIAVLRVGGSQSSSEQHDAPESRAPESRTPEHTAADGPLLLPPRPAYLPDLRAPPAALLAAAETYATTFAHVHPMVMLPNGLSHMGNVVNGRAFSGQVEHRVRIGRLQQWNLTNAGTTMNHPFHMHIHPVQVLGAAVAGSSTGGPGWPDYDGQYLDTLLLPTPGALEVRFLPADHFVGRTILHCHILPHATLGMMQMIELVGDGDGGGDAEEAGGEDGGSSSASTMPGTPVAALQTTPAPGRVVPPEEYGLGKKQRGAVLGLGGVLLAVLVLGLVSYFRSSLTCAAGKSAAYSPLSTAA